MALTATPNVRGFIADLDCVASGPAAAVHRLAVALGRTSGVPDVGRVLVQEITGGGQVLALISLAERLDSRPFTRADAAVLRALTAPAALAFEREAIRRQAAAFARAAAIDPVSGLYNRRHFHARLREELQRAERRDSSVALLMIDLDDFKRIN